MLIDIHAHSKSPLDIRNRTAYVQQYAIWMRRGNLEAVGLEEIDDRLIILLRWTESSGELIRSQKLAKGRGCRIIKVAQKIRQPLRIAQRQSDCQRNTPVSRQPTFGLQANDCGRNMTGRFLS